VRAIEALARVGMSGHVSIDDLKARLIEQVRVMREWATIEGVTKEQLERLGAELRAGRDVRACHGRSWRDT
jgi:hypothetical protein